MIGKLADIANDALDRDDGLTFLCATFVAVVLFAATIAAFIGIAVVVVALSRWLLFALLAGLVGLAVVRVARHR